MTHILNKKVSLDQILTATVTYAEGGEIELTQAEKDMIRVKRDQEELKKKERELEQQQERNKEIIREQKQVEQYVKDNQTYTKAAKDFYDKFEMAYPGEFELVELADKQESNDLYDYEYDDQGKRKKDDNDNWIKNYYYKQPYILKQYEIKYKKNKKYTIEIYKHEIYGSGFYGGHKATEYVLRAKGLNEWKETQKNLKNAKTVKDKIDHDISSHQNKLSAEQREKEGLQFVLDFVKEKYKEQDPTVKMDSEYKKSYDNKRHWEEKWVMVEFKNGLKVKYKWKFDNDAYSAYIYNVDVHGLNYNEAIVALLNVGKGN